MQSANDASELVDRLSAEHLRLENGHHDYRWFNPAAGQPSEAGRIEVSDGVLPFQPPFENDAVLYLKRAVVASP